MDVSWTQQYISRDKDAPKSTPLKSKYQIIAEEYRAIKEWKPQSDVWPLTTGRSILISMSVLTGIYINHRFRAKLKLRSYGTLPTMLGVTLATSAATAVSHTELVNKLLLLEIPCPLCMESTSALAQTCSGLLVPLIITPVANFSIAAGSGMYNVPHVTDVKKIYSVILSIYQPLFPKLVMIFTFHALMAGFITYLEIKSYLRLLDLQYLTKEEETKN